MEITTDVSLVERKKFDNSQPHQIARGIWWVGFYDDIIHNSHNPFLLVDQDEAILINPGSGASDHFKIVSKKVASIIDPTRIQHIVVNHHDPDCCGSLKEFEKMANRNVSIYAPSDIAPTIRYYGCKNPVISLDRGDSIIMKSGRTIDFFATPDLPHTGSGFFYDETTGTVFVGNIMGSPSDDWNLFAEAGSWDRLTPCRLEGWGSKKALLLALNKIERLSPERICPQQGPIMEEHVDRYIAAARKLDRSTTTQEKP